MITLQELSSFLDLLLTPLNFSDDCPNGLQVEGKEEIRTLAFAVSASLAAIEAAVQLNADALIVHHGIFWQKDPLPLCGPKKQKVEKLLKNGISLLGYHLPLDAHQSVGNNWKAAQDLGWFHLEPFGLFRKTAIGVKGKFPKMPIEEFRKSSRDLLWPCGPCRPRRQKRSGIGGDYLWRRALECCSSRRRGTRLLYHRKL